MGPYPIENIICNNMIAYEIKIYVWPSMWSLKNNFNITRESLYFLSNLVGDEAINSHCNIEICVKLDNM
jgi:hypothetical protein